MAFFRRNKNRKSIFFFIILIIIGVGGLFFFNNLKKASAEWFDQNWYYRQAVTITVTSSASDVSNLDTWFTMNTSALISANKLQSSCQDLRFTNASGKLLPYYIDSGCNTTTTKIWVKADLVPKNSTTYTLYAYYGNPAAPAVSDSNKFNLYNGLIGYWNMNEASGAGSALGDLSVNGNNGTAVLWGGGNTATDSAHVAGKFGNAFSFDGIDDYIDAGNGASLDTYPLTIGTWIKTTDSTNNKGIINKYLSSSANGYQIFMIGGRIKAWYFKDGSNFTRQDVDADDGGIINDGNWHYVTYTVDAGGGKIFVDGQLKNSKPWTGTPGATTTTQNLHFGDYGVGINRNLNALIDDSRIYNRALSASEITQTYSDGTSSILTAVKGQSVPSVSFATEEKSPAPVAYWKFDEGQGLSADDSTSNNNLGTLSGATKPAWQTSDQCVSGKCLKFDGSTSYIDVADNSILGPANITVEAWIKTPTISTEQAIASKFYQPAGYVGWMFEIYQSKLSLAINTNANKQGNTVLSSNTWYHVSATYDGSTINLYVNGANDGSLNTAAGITSPTGNLNIGRYTLSSNLWFNGFMDDVKIYPYARTAAQIKADYASRGSVSGTSAQVGGQTSGISNGLISYWKMDETAGAGSTLADSSGNGNTGTASLWGGGNTATDSAHVAGKYGNAFSFDGEDDYINNGSSTIYDSTSASTITAWVKPTAGNTTLNLINAYGIDWTNPASWSYSTSGTSFAWDDANSALKVVSYYNVYLTTRIPIDTSKNYYLEFDVMTKNNVGGKILYAGTHSYDASGSVLPGHPGSYDYFEESGTSFTQDTWYHRKNVVISGAPRTGESSNTSDYNKWHTGTKYATIMFLFNYSGSSIQETYIKNLRFYSTESEIGKPNAYDISVTDTSFSGRINGQRISTALASGWNFVAMTYDRNAGSNQQKLYVNGALATQGTLTEAINVNTNNFLTYLKGSLDEVRVYNRALPPNEISDLYNFASGPVGWWKMDDKVSGNNQTLVDSSTYGSNATTHWGGNASGMDCTRVGQYGGACNFDGTDDYASATLAGPAAGALSAFTLNAWIYTRTAPAATGVGGVSRASYNSAGDIHLYVYNSKIYGEATFASGGFKNAGSLTIPLNQWHFYSLVYDGSKLSFYMDGSTLIGSVNVAADTIAASSVFNIGTVTGNYSNGLIDNVQIYSYARTQKQIAEDMNAGHPSVGSPVGSYAAYWKFDEGYGNPKDQSVNGNNATSNNASWTNDGKFGKALSFDGINSSVGVSNSSSLNNLTQFTLSAWVKSNTFSTDSNVGTIINKGPESAVQHFWFFVHYPASGSKLDLEMGDASTYYNFQTAALTWTPSQWYHVAVTFMSDGTNSTASFYRNGQFLNTQTMVKNLNSGTYDMLIGKYGFNMHDFPGIIDEVKIYPFALTAADIQTEYNRGALKMGSLSNTSGLSGGSVASNSASAIYCIPGDTTSCNPPVGEWGMNEYSGVSANDTSGNGNTGSLGGGTAAYMPTWQGSGACHSGYCLYFDGTNDYVSAGNGASLNVTDLTVEAWVKVDTVVPQYQVFASKVQDGSNRNWEFVINYDEWYLKIGASAAKTTTAFNIVPGQWYHAVMTFKDSTDTLRLYVNGAFYQEWNETGNIGSPVGNLVIGNWSTGNNYPYKGYIDNLAVFNYARTPAQVAWDYSRGKPVGWWKFDECQGASAYDYSGNGNVGTVTIGATGSQTTAGTCTTPSDGTAAWYNGKAGKFNSAMSFDGTDDNASINNASILKPSLPITVSAWVKPAALASYPNVFASDNSATYYGYLLQLDSTGKVSINYGDGTAAGSASARRTKTSTSSIAVGNWYHIVGVIRGATDMSIYINGVDGGGTYSGSGGSIAYSASASVIANSTPWGNNYFNGLIDDVKVYNYAQTSSQVKMDYNQGGAVRFGPTSGRP